MKSVIHGWVVVNPKHPNTGKEMLVDSSFARTRTEAINKFIEGSSKDWKFWRNKWNYRVIKAKISIEPFYKQP